MMSFLGRGKQPIYYQKDKRQETKDKSQKTKDKRRETRYRLRQQKWPIIFTGF